MTGKCIIFVAMMPIVILQTHAFWTTMKSNIDRSMIVGKSFVLHDSSLGARDASSTLQMRPFLSTLLSSRSSEDQKLKVLDDLQRLRSSQSPRASSAESNDEYANFLDDIISTVEEIQKNKIAMIKWIIPLPSYRVKLASLYRIYYSILEEERKNQLSPNPLNEKAIKRRSIAVLLNQLKSTKGVRALESEAEQRLKRSDTMTEMLERTPKLETPQYQVIAQKNKWEIRKYEPFSVCSYNMEENAVGPAAFNQLAGYIFGGNQPQQKMAMTTPVIFQESNSRKMSFVMPSKFWQSSQQLSEAPLPLENSGVRLELEGGGLISDTNTVAVLWFGGYATKASISLRTEELLTAVRADTEWEIMEGQTPYCMQYNDPFQPPWKRRNEVAIPVKRRN
eukprot:gene7068-14380_t